VTYGGDYALPIDPLGGSIALHLDGRSQTKQFGDPTGSAYTVIGGYTLVNGSVGFRSRRGWEIAVFTRNLFDRNYIQNVTIQAGNTGLILATPSDPRTVGVTFRARQ